MSLSRIFAGLLVIAGAGAMAMPVRAADDDTRVIMMTMRVFQLKVDARDDGGHASVPVLKDLPIVAALEGDAVRLVVAGTEIDGFLHEQAKHCVSAPRVFTRSGQAASVQIGREIAFESMQPTTQPGVFRLVAGEPKFEGMRFDVLAEVGKAGGVEIRKFTMKFDQMVGREKVEGTSLEVGAPIMRTRESTHAVGLKPGQRAVLTTAALDGSLDGRLDGRLDGSHETLLVVLEATVVDDNPGLESTPYTKGAGGR